MKAKYKKFSNAYMLYLRLRHIYGKGAGFGKDITFLAIKDRWEKLYKIHKERSLEK